MKRPLVYPKSPDGDIELLKLIEFFNETLGFCPNSVKKPCTSAQELLTLLLI